MIDLVYPISGAGNVGGPIPCTEVKLVDTEDYKSNDVYPKTAVRLRPSLFANKSFRLHVL